MTLLKEILRILNKYVGYLREQGDINPILAARLSLTLYIYNMKEHCNVGSNYRKPGNLKAGVENR